MGSMRGTDSRCLRFPAALGLVLLLAWLPASRAQDEADPFREAREHLDTGRADEVVAAVESVLAAHPEDADLHVAASSLLRDASRPDAAIVVCRRAVALRPDDPAVRLALARSMVDAAQAIRGPDERRDAWSAAAEVFGEAVSLAPDSLAILVEWAKALETAGRHADAFSAWSRVVALDPGQQSGHAGIVRAMAASSRWDELRTLASNTRELPPEVGWPVALAAYDEAATEKQYGIADSILPTLRALAEGGSRDFAVKALDAVANRPYDQALAWLAKYMETEPAPGDAEVVYNAVVERGLGEIPHPKRLPTRRGQKTALGEVTLPRVVQKFAPYYPRDLEARGIEGRVMVQAVVRTDGTIGRLKVLHSSHPHFTVAALDAVKRWYYMPALEAGEPVAIYYTIQVDFVPTAKPRSPRKKK